VSVQGDSEIKPIRIAALLLIPILLASCVGAVIQGSGDLVVQEPDITGFDRLDISHAFHADVLRGEDWQVIITIDDNLVEYLDVRKAGKTLVVDLKDIDSLVDGTLEVEITMPTLTAIELSGASRAEVNGFESTEPFSTDVSGASVLSGELTSGNAQFDVSGASNVTLAGEGDTIQVDVSDSSRVDLAQFIAGDGLVDASGASSVTVNLSGRLDGSVSGAATVNALGNPTLGEFETSGAGSINTE
jgi:hypothetical protein